MIKQILPKSLLGRSVLIIVTPLVLLQVVAGAIFYESHWDKVSLRLARGVAGDVAAVLSLLRDSDDPRHRIHVFAIAGEHMEIEASLKEGAILPNTPPVGTDMMERTLIRAMNEYVGKPFQIDTRALERYVIIDVQLADGVLELITPRKRLFSSTTYVFVIWMAGTSMVLFGVAMIFMRNQVKPIRRLAHAADDFGKGREVKDFKPEGATEVRQAATAFLAMQERIQRQISQRTDMLSGVSHDLRTPLTRMRLELAMLKGTDPESVHELEHDVDEMEHMLEAYLAFARGEGGEKPVPTDLGHLLDTVVDKARRKGGLIDLHTEGVIEVPLRPNAMRRCVTNLVENAARYAEHVSVRAGRRKEWLEITVDDDGPGIPEDKRDDVFKPFFRLEASRNPETGGTGLGLAIARDVVRGHGGDIELADAPTGGLRARIRLPL